MDIVLWVLQILLAVHTTMGAVWKFYHSEQTVPSLSVLPHGVWRSLSFFELSRSLALVAPALGSSLGLLAPVAAVCIGAEMLLFCGVHLYSGTTKHGQMIYWLVVATVCGSIAYGRLVLRPI